MQQYDRLKGVALDVDVGLQLIHQAIGVNSYWARGLEPPPTFEAQWARLLSSPPLFDWCFCTLHYHAGKK